METTPRGRTAASDWTRTARVRAWKPVPSAAKAKTLLRCSITNDSEEYGALADATIGTVCIAGALGGCAEGGPVVCPRALSWREDAIVARIKQSFGTWGRR